MLVDATSGGGGCRSTSAQTDVYYFAPQKNFASDGGLWIAAVLAGRARPGRRDRRSDRWIPRVLDLAIAVDNSTQDQTYNTPAVATLLLLVDQIEWC